jgi:hypothetical protein
MALYPIPVKVPAQAPSNATGERPIRHLNQVDLSRRWSISPRTLERWRWLQAGPRYLKIGGRVVYRLEDVELRSGLAEAGRRKPQCPQARQGSQRRSRGLAGSLETVPRFSRLCLARGPSYE